LSDSPLLLSIETVVGGGSIALFQKGNAVLSRVYDSATARSESLLQGIAAMMDEAGLKPSEIGRLAVSTGPGSYTGIRIGMATAMGFRGALSIDLFGISMLGALAASTFRDRARIAAMPFGRDEVCFQPFRAGAVVDCMGDPEVMSTADFRMRIVSAEMPVIVLGSLKSHLNIDELFEDTQQLIAAEQVPAELIGRAALSPSIRHDLTPIYVRNPRYAV
jgi:tRNA threonylcarbamoyladenosine biosynthesis protein TsaB